MSDLEMLSLYWEYEDDLPEMTDLEYDLLFHQSRVISGVRMYPYTRYWDHEKQCEVKAYLGA